MLLLLFQVGENLYGIDSTQVIEVLPLVQLRPLDAAPSYIAGILNYHGTLVPAVDLCSLIRGSACESRFSTRMMIVNYPTRTGTQAYLALLAERVTETLQCADRSLEAAQPTSGSYLGQLFIHDRGMIQMVHWQALVSEAQQALQLVGG